MRLSRSLGGLSFGVAISLAATAEGGEGNNENDYALPYVERTLTLSERTLSPHVTFDVTRLIKGSSDVDRELETGFTVEAGATYGITNWLEVDAALATLRLSPEFGYGDPRLGVTLHFLTSTLEMGLRAQAIFLTESEKAGTILEPSLPMLIHLGTTARLDLGIGAPITIQKNKATTIGLDIPVALALNSVDTLHLGVRSSVFIPDLENPGKTITIPLGIFGGFTYGTENPLIEVDPFFVWPQFAQPSIENPEFKNINTDIFSVGVTARGYLYF